MPLPSWKFRYLLRICRRYENSRMEFLLKSKSSVFIYSVISKENQNNRRILKILLNKQYSAREYELKFLRGTQE